LYQRFTVVYKPILLRHRQHVVLRFFNDFFPNHRYDQFHYASIDAKATLGTIIVIILIILAAAVAGVN